MNDAHGWREWSPSVDIGPIAIRWRLDDTATRCRVQVSYSGAGLIMDVVLWREREQESFSLVSGIAGELRFVPCVLTLVRLQYPGGEVRDRVLEAGPPAPCPPAPPYSPLERDDGEAPAEVEPVADVFPYLHLQGWPRAPESAFGRHFVHYRPPPQTRGPVTVSYYERLVLLRATAPDARVAMLEETLRFVQGEHGYHGQYAARARELHGPIRLMGRLCEDLQREPPPSVPALVAVVEDAFGEPWSRIAEQLHGNAFGEQLDRVWLSLFALNVVVAFDREAVEQLTPTLVLAELLRQLPAEGPLPDWPAARIADALQAQLLLPATVFPLPPAHGPQAVEVEVEPPPVWPYAIGRLRIVRRKLTSYRCGAVAHVENVMAGERKMRTRRELLRRQDKEAVELGDHAGEQRAGQEREQSFEATAHQTLREAFRTEYSTTYGPATPATQTGFVQMNWPQDGNPPATLPATRQGDDSSTGLGHAVMQESARRFSRDMAQRRQRGLDGEIEFAGSQCFDRRGAAEHQRGIYRWVDAVHECWEVERGRRWLLEIVLPHPGRGLHEKLPLRRQGHLLADPLALRRFIRGELRRQALRCFVALVRRKTGAEPGLRLPALLAWLDRAVEWEEASHLLVEDLRDEAPAWLAEDDDGERLMAFLHAAFAQLLLPVRPGQEMAVAYFLATGNVWEAPQRLAPTFETAVADAGALAPLRFVDLVLALREAGLDSPDPASAVPERPVGRPWTVVLPTTMTLLQKGDKLPHFPCREAMLEPVHGGTP